MTERATTATDALRRAGEALRLSARLMSSDVRRLEAHEAACARCCSAAEDPIAAAVPGRCEEGREIYEGLTATLQAIDTDYIGPAEDFSEAIGKTIAALRIDDD